MTLEQEIKLAAKHAAEKASEKEKLENARNFKESGVSLEIISKCTGLSLEEVEAL